jgi:Cof subfamily protein (haloacid dehalogenase superfamily)
MSWRVVATDLDGTIVRSDGEISARTRDALTVAEQAGALVVLVTGRPPRWLDGVADATGHHGLAICANGAIVYDLHTERIVETHPLSVEIARELVAQLRGAIPGLGFAVETADDGFAHEAAYRPKWSVDTDPVASADELLTQPLVKLLARHPELDSDALLAAAREAVGVEAANLTHSSRDGLLEISAAGVSKATTLAALCEEHGMSAAQTIAFGDMPNDIPMLSWAGRAVAVANAHPEVLEIVDEVTASNDDDGVAVVLEREFAG